jgi:hypothetical protein
LHAPFLEQFLGEANEIKRRAGETGKNEKAGNEIKGAKGLKRQKGWS